MDTVDCIFQIKSEKLLKKLKIYFVFFYFETEMKVLENMEFMLS